MTDEFGRLRRRLIAQSYLFEDPGAYRAGVEDALDETLRVLREHDASWRVPLRSERKPPVGASMRQPGIA